MRIPSLHRSSSPHAARQYPVLMSRQLISQFRLIEEQAIPACQRGGCNHAAGYARVWLSPVESGRHALSNLRHGVYYCEAHAQEASATSGVPLIDTVQVLQCYQRSMLAARSDQSAPDATAAPLSRDPVRILLATYEHGSLLRLADGSLEVLATDGRVYAVCCQRQGRVAATAPEHMAHGGHSRTCANYVRPRAR